MRLDRVVTAWSRRGQRVAASARARVPLLDHGIRAGSRYVADGGIDHAAALTYYTLAALFPLLLLVTSGLGFVLQHNAELYDKITERIAASTFLTTSVQTVIDLRSITGIIAVVGLLWIGTGWVAALRRGVRRLWHLPANDRGFVIGRVLDLGRLVVLGAVLLLSIGLAVLGATVGSWFSAVLGNAPVLVRLTAALTFLLGFLVDIAFVAWLYAMAAGSWRHINRHVLGGVVLGSIAVGLLKIIGAEVYGAAVRHYQEKYTATAVALLATLLLLRWFSSVLTFCAAWCVTAKGSDDVPPSGTARRPEAAGPALPGEPPDGDAPGDRRLAASRGGTQPPVG